MLGTQNDPSVAVPTAMAAKPTAMQIGGSRTLLAFVAAVAACDESAAITHLRWQRHPGKLHRHGRESRP
jgi:hypothetical protein